MALHKIAVIGAGGKTTALGLLARQNSGSVLVTTTTHIFPMTGEECRVCLVDPSPTELIRELQIPGIVCAGSSSRQGKIASLPEPLFNDATQMADLLVYEADGANRHPLKLHNSAEPVMLAGTTRCLVVAGLSACGKPVSEVIHRYARNHEWALAPDRPVGEEEILYCVEDSIASSGFPEEHIRLFLNQEDTLTDPGIAISLKNRLAAMGYQVRSGSLQKDTPSLLSWVLGED